MSYSNRKRNYSSSREEKYSLGILLPLIALLAVIPLITFMHSYSTNLGQFEWYTAVTEAVDFFLYEKMVWIIVACIYMIFCLVYLFFAEEKKVIWIKQLIPMAVYCAISLISAIASEYSYFSFHGIFEQFEPVWILIGYGIIVYYGFYIMHSEQAVRKTMNWFMAGIAVMSALGLSQVFKHDFFRSDLGQKLITPSSYNGGPLTFNFEIGRPYLSLYNPNYVGFYAAMTIPVLLAILLAVKKVWTRVISAVLMAAVLLILFASQSRAGILALAFSLVIMLLCMRRVFIKNWIVGVIGIVVVIGGFFVVNAMNQNVLITRLQSMFTTEPEYYPLKEIQTNDDNVTVVYLTPERALEAGKSQIPDSLVFKVTQDKDGNDEFHLADGDGEDVDFTISEDNITYVINDARFPFTFSSVRDESFSGFVINIDGIQWYLSNLMKEDGTYYCRGGAGALMKLARITESVPYLDKHYRLANMRGYIWDRTIPLLKKYFFLGSGPDTFIIAFPNSDLVGLYNSGHINEIITKPHCMYLQIGVQTGVISLIALLVFFGWYLIDSLVLYWRCNYSEYLTFIGVGIVAAVIGYLILGLTNDSCTALSPIFYTLLGIGAGINHKIRTQMPQVIIHKAKPKAGEADQHDGQHEPKKTAPAKQEKSADQADNSSAPSDTADRGSSPEAKKTAGNINPPDQTKTAAKKKSSGKKKKKRKK